jgi:hypothetical protein
LTAGLTAVVTGLVTRTFTPLARRLWMSEICFDGFSSPSVVYTFETAGLFSRYHVPPTAF